MVAVKYVPGVSTPPASLKKDDKLVAVQTATPTPVGIGKKPQKKAAGAKGPHSISKAPQQHPKQKPAVQYASINPHTVTDASVVGGIPIPSSDPAPQTSAASNSEAETKKEALTRFQVLTHIDEKLLDKGEITRADLPAMSDQLFELVSSGSVVGARSDGKITKEDVVAFMTTLKAFEDVSGMDEATALKTYNNALHFEMKDVDSLKNAENEVKNNVEIKQDITFGKLVKGFPGFDEPIKAEFARLLGIDISKIKDTTKLSEKLKKTEDKQKRVEDFYKFVSIQMPIYSLLSEQDQEQGLNVRNKIKEFEGDFNGDNILAYYNIEKKKVSMASLGMDGGYGGVPAGAEPSGSSGNSQPAGKTGEPKLDDPKVKKEKEKKYRSAALS